MTEAAELGRVSSIEMKPLISDINLTTTTDGGDVCCWPAFTTGQRAESIRHQVISILNQNETLFLSTVGQPFYLQGSLNLAAITMFSVFECLASL